MRAHIATASAASALALAVAIGTLHAATPESPASAADAAARPAPARPASDQPASDRPASAQPSGATRTVPLSTAPHTRTSSDTAPATAFTLPRRDVRPFAMLGVTWDDPRTELHALVSVRVRSAGTGAWSDWQQVAHAHLSDGPGAAERDAGTRGATPPLWVGPADGVEVRVVAESHDGAPAEPLPQGLRLDMVDPGKAPETRTGPAAEERGYGAPRPGITTRKGWGADEKLREKEFAYTSTVKAAFVHHTATGNGYSCKQAPSVIRSIYRYHVKSSGWRDIGYNFLVDKCGRIYEGRAGGTARPVLGAHTLGFNTNSTGIAAIGTYSSAKPTRAMQEGIAKIAGWKLGLHGANAKGSVRLVSGDSGSRYKKGTAHTFKRISGHRDGFATECPGRALYAKLGYIRSTAGAYQAK